MDPDEVRKAWSLVADNMHDIIAAPEDVDSLRQACLALAASGHIEGCTNFSTRDRYPQECAEHRRRT